MGMALFISKTESTKVGGNKGFVFDQYIGSKEQTQ